MAAAQTNEQRELAELIVTALNLEDVDPAMIDPDAALFGAGLGLGRQELLAQRGQVGLLLRHVLLDVDQGVADQAVDHGIGNHEQQR